MKYAQNTTVSPEKTRLEIELMLTKYNASGFAFIREDASASIAFKMKNRTLRFNLKLPSRKLYASDRQFDQAVRSLWRGLFLSIKGKLVAVDNKVEMFEEVFLSNIVMPDGRTIAEHIIPKIDVAYLNSGKMPSLLPGIGETGTGNNSDYIDAET